MNNGNSMDPKTPLDQKMNMNLQNISQMAIKQLKENWKWFLGLGGLLVVLGTLAVIYAFTSTMISVVVLGGLLIAFGIFEGVKAFKFNEWRTFLLHAFLGILYLVGGIFMIWHPLANAISLTLLLAIFFVVAGIMRIYTALTHDMPHKGWVLLNGAITLLLGGLIWYQMPSAALWVLGTFLGIDMIFTGWTWIMLSNEARKGNLQPINKQNIH